MVSRDEAEPTAVTLELADAHGAVLSGINHEHDALIISAGDITVHLIAGPNPAESLIGLRRIVEALWTLQIAIETRAHNLGPRE